MKKVKELKKNKDSKTVQKVVVGGLISFIMIFSILGFFSNSYHSTKKMNYNGFNFYITNKGMFLKYDGKPLQFQYYPSSLENMSYNDNINNLLRNSKQIYVTSDANDTLVQAIGTVKYLFASTLASVSKYVQNSYTTNVSGLPVISCANATSNTPVVYFYTSNKTSISLQNNCVKVTAYDQNGFLSAENRILYGFLGVMK